MSKFIYFTPEEKARAQNTDLVSLLRAQGERPVRSGREFRTPNDPSITVRGNKWFDHSARVGGYAVSFVQRYQDIDDRVIGGITFKGRTYKRIGYDWIEYVAQIDDGRALSIGLTDIDCVPGTMPDVILSGMTIK